MSGTIIRRPALAEHLRTLHDKIGAAEVLSYLCEMGRQLAGAGYASVSYVLPGTPWQRGIHLPRVDDRAAQAALISAAFAIHRRLIAAAGPIEVAPTADNAAIFRGLGVKAEDGSLRALPIFNRRRRLVGQLVLFVPIGAAGDEAAVAELLALTAHALEGAQRLSLARRDQDRLQAFSEATEDVLWDWDRDADTFWWGGGVARLIRTGAEVIGMSFAWKSDRIHPADHARVQASFSGALASDQPVWREEYRFRRGNGSWAYVEDRAFFLRDQHGRAYRAMGVLSDISAREWSQVQQDFLLRADAELSASFDVAANLGAVARVAVGTVTDLCVLLLLSPDESGAHVVAIAGAPGGDDACARLAQAIATGLEEPGDAPRLVRAAVDERFGEEERVRLAALSEPLAELVSGMSPASLAQAPILSGERLLGAVLFATAAGSTRCYRPEDLGLVEEVARRCANAVEKARLYEQAQEAIRARDTFMAILGHELRNPLAPITTALHLMRLRDPRGTREREVIERQVKHLTRLVDDLLDVARIERGKLELARRPLQLAEVVARAVEIVGPLFEARRQHLELQIPATELPILADELRLTQVVSNLLTNAARYTDEGGRISVVAVREDRSAVLRVRDNGIGMSPELLPRLFDLFVQGPRTPDRREGGLGLGLSLVRSLVALHGGSVEAQSEGPGKGSEFVVRLPLAPVSVVPPPPTEAAAPQRVRGAELRVLLVDDNHDGVELLAEYLQQKGFEVVTAEDGPAGLAAAAAFDPEVAVLDIGLPVMDGHELARQMIATLPRRPYMIALTGYGLAHDQQRSHAVGFDEHLLKPVDLDRLTRILEERRQLGAAGRVHEGS